MNDLLIHDWCFNKDCLVIVLGLQSSVDQLILT